MKPKRVHLALCAPGAALPYRRLAPRPFEHGLDARLFFAELSGSRVGAFFAAGVLVSAAALPVFAGVEGRGLRFRGEAGGAGHGRGGRLTRAAAVPLPARAQARAGRVSV